MLEKLKTFSAFQVALTDGDGEQHQEATWSLGGKFQIQKKITLPSISI